MTKKFVRLLLLSVVAELLSGFGSATQVTLSESDQGQSVVTAGANAGTTVDFQSTGGTAALDGVTSHSLNGDFTVALENTGDETRGRTSSREVLLLSIPEPAALVLLGTGLLVMARLIKHRWQ
jgi:hypothetical protein